MKSLCSKAKIHYYSISIFMIFTVMVAAVDASTISITDPNPVTRAFSSDGAAVVTTVPITGISSSSFNTGLVTSEYSSWSVNTGTSSPGTFSVSSYDAGFTSSSGGAQIQVTYDNGSPVSAGQQLQWVQFISTNSPLGGTSSPYIDPRPNDDTLPFYWTSAELPSYTSGNSLGFSDFSKRSISQLSTTDPIEWRANLFQVQWDGATTITANDGLQWGWDMKSATEGSASGEFVNPSPSGPPAVLSGVGTSNFTWGDGSAFGSPSSSLSFVGNSFNPAPGDVFSLGTLSYYNGTIAENTQADFVDLFLSVSFDNVPDKSTSIETSLSLINTLNYGVDQWADADYVNFISGGYNHSFHVFEGQTAQVELLAKIVANAVIPQDKSTDLLGFGTFATDMLYSFELIGFGDVTGGGFTTSTVVPEPGSLILAASGLLTTVINLYRRRKDT
ncbi:MAG: choice-of-anchor K domain-containing protein [Sedimentisphaerales bacterium]|nr:choice-of-anchor K domain-containing protein [Sedimentisphaerales bacterium]